MEKCVTKVVPFNNRFIVFVTNDYTFHGHPQPLDCPEHEARKSLILYHYTSRTRNEIARDDAHRALWCRRANHRCQILVPVLTGTAPPRHAQSLSRDSSGPAVRKHWPACPLPSPHIDTLPVLCRQPRRESPRGRLHHRQRIPIPFDPARRSSL